MSKYRRIVSLAPSNTEILFSLGLSSEIVGITTLCDYPQQVANIPKIGSWLNIRDIEILEKLNPDLLLGSMFVPKEIEDWCDAKDISLYVVNPSTIDDVLHSFQEIGTLLGREERSQELISQFLSQLDLIAEQSTFTGLRIYNEEFHNPPMVGNNWVPELIEMAGGIPMGEKGIPSQKVDKEDVMAFNPDLAILHWCGFQNSNLVLKIFKSRQWDFIEHVFVVDDTFLNRPGPRLPHGVYIIQKILSSIGHKAQ